MPTVLLLTGGDAPHPALVLPPADVVVAADSGADQAATLGIDVDVLVGDLDSVAAATIAEVEAAGGRVVRHPRDKDATDVELALDLVVELAPTRIVAVGGHGGRVDHALATMVALAAVAVPGRRVEAWMGSALVQLTADEVTVDGRVGELVSLLPLGGPADEVTTSGLRWPLASAHLPYGSTRGVSNEVATAPAGVTVGGGVLAVVRPHALTPDHDEPAHVPPGG